jgi:hypothetical protein
VVRVRGLGPRGRDVGSLLEVELESLLALDVAALEAIRVREELLHEPVAVGVAVDVDAEAGISVQYSSASHLFDASLEEGVLLKQAV